MTERNTTRLLLINNVGFLEAILRLLIELAYS